MPKLLKKEKKKKIYILPYLSLNKFLTEYHIHNLLFTYKTSKEMPPPLKKKKEKKIQTDFVR